MCIVHVDWRRETGGSFKAFAGWTRHGRRQETTEGPAGARGKRNRGWDTVIEQDLPPLVAEPDRHGDGWVPEVHDAEPVVGGLCGLGSSFGLKLGQCTVW